jgi:hypothetical protein
LLRAIQTELAADAAAREQDYRHVDPGQLARSLPGFAEISAPSPGRRDGPARPFRDGTRFKSYADSPREPARPARPTARAGPMSKAGPFPAAVGVRPRRRHRPPPGPAARPDLLPADDRTRSLPPQGLLCRRRAPGRTGLDRAAPWHAVRDLRQRRHPVTADEAKKITADK